MTLRSSDLKSDRDLDSIRNSCDVYFYFHFYFYFYTTTTRFDFAFLHNFYPCGERGAKFTIQLLRFSYREQHPKCVLSEKWIASIFHAGDKKKIYDA